VVVFPDLKKNLITLVTPSRNFNTKQTHAYFDDDKTTTDRDECAVRTIHCFANLLAGRSEKISLIIHRAHCVLF